METAPKPRLVLILGLVLAVILGAGCESFWSDSEIWNAVVVKYMFTGHPSYNFYVKPLFDFLLFLNFQVAHLLNVHPMVTGRFFFALNAALAAGFLFQLCRRWGQSAPIAALAVFFWASGSFFIKRATHLRSDALIMTLILGLFVLRESSTWRTRGPLFRLAVSALAAVAGFLITPKSILLSVPWMLIFLAPDARVLIRRYRWWTVIGLAGLACVAMFSSSLHASALFFVKSFTTDNTGLPYFNVIRLEHTLRFVRENALFVLLWCFQWYFGLWQRHRLSPSVRPIFDYANLLLVLLIVYPDRLPFFIFGLSPFFILPLAASWPELRRHEILSHKQWQHILALVLGFSTMSALFWTSFVCLRHNSRTQQAFVGWLNSKSEQLEGLEIYDVVGVIPFARVNHWFLGPAEARNIDVLDHLMHERVDLIVGSAKLELLGQPFFDLASRDYVDRGGLYVRQWTLDRHHTSMSVAELEHELVTRMPFLPYHLNHRVSVEMLTSDGTRQTRYAHWVDENGQSAPFSQEFSLSQMRAYARLWIPPGVTQLKIRPIELLTPFSENWMQLFRFDSEF